MFRFIISIHGPISRSKAATSSTETKEHSWKTAVKYSKLVHDAKIRLNRPTFLLPKELDNCNTGQRYGMFAAARKIAHSPTANRRKTVRNLKVGISANEKPIL
jgi:hypothetical protein